MATPTRDQATRSRVSLSIVARWVKGGKSANMRSLSHNSFQAILALDECKRRLNESFGIRLRAQPIMSPVGAEKDVKKFCGELLDRVSPNEWKVTIRDAHLPLHVRVSIASSLFSTRKVLNSEKPDSRSYVRKMTEQQAPASPAFLRFCEREVSRQLPFGWDKSYWSKVENFIPPNKSNIDKKENGTYRSQAIRDPGLRPRVGRWLNGTVTSPISTRVSAGCVFTGGKWRVITLSDPSVANLLPLHRCFYDALTKKKWLLRGEARPESFSDFSKSEGEVFVSGDYEGATDNLNLDVSKCVLSAVLRRAQHIPLRVREEAERSLEMDFEFVEGGVTHYRKQTRGQLMGSPLSFPLLCLINYLTFKYAVRRDVPVKINGDDIVFRASQSESDVWFRSVQQSGLKVSAGKTLVHKSFFSLNSSYFLANSGAPSVIPHFRASLIRKCEDMAAFAGRVAQIKRDLAVGDLRCRALRDLVHKNFNVIYSGQGSFSRRYLCPLPKRVLRAVRLDDREDFYRSFADEPMPLEKYTFERQAVVPPGWKKKNAVWRGWEVVPSTLVSSTFVDRTWSEPFLSETKDEYWARVRDGSFRYVPFSQSVKRLFFKYSGVTYRPKPVPPYRRKKCFWVREVGCEGVAFRSGGLLSDQ